MIRIPVSHDLIKLFVTTERWKNDIEKYMQRKYF